MLDWKVAPSQYRRQQVLASLDLDHLLLLRGYVATTGKYMFIFSFLQIYKILWVVEIPKLTWDMDGWERRRS